MVQINKLLQEIIGKTIKEQLAFLSGKFNEKIVFSTSFGQEDQLISDIIFRNNIPIKVFTLDTGRFFEETYKVWSKTLEKYSKSIFTYFPDKNDLEILLKNKGPFSFYESVENRKECCNIRKVIPLKRALQGVDLWITGLRAEQSEARKELPLLQWDEGFKLIKFNPLKDWKLDEVIAYLKKNQIPYNSLHDKGFVSIGCAPCTRAIKSGESIRRGRWWWEDNTKKECGLHESAASESDNVLNIKKYK